MESGLISISEVRVALKRGLRERAAPRLPKHKAVALMCRAESMAENVYWTDRDGNMWSARDFDCGFSRGVAVEAGGRRMAERYDPADVTQARVVRSKLAAWAREA